MWCRLVAAEGSYFATRARGAPARRRIQPAADPLRAWWRGLVPGFTGFSPCP
jgi:hypothetical protein